MKRQFSWLIMLMMFLLNASSMIEGSVVASQVAATASGRFVTAAESKVFKALTAQITESAAKSFMKSLGQEGIEALAKESAESSLTILAKAAKIAVSSVGDDAAKAIMNSMGRSAAAIEKIGGNFALMGDDVVSKIGTKDFTTILASNSDDVISKAFTDIGVTNQAQISKLTSLAKSAGSALDNVSAFAKVGDDVLNPMTNNFGSSADNLIGAVDGGALNTAGKASKSGFFEKTANLTPDEVLLRKQAEVALKPSSKASLVEREAAISTLQRLEMKASSKFDRLFSSLGLGHIPGFFLYAGATVSAALLFMLPSLVQAAFLAQQQRNALLQTYIPPVKFGNVVLQLPDSVINLENPAMSQFIYYGIPVNNPGDKLSKQAAALYKGVSGPTSNNKVSQAIDNSYAKAFTLGIQKNNNVDRYNLDANALAKLPIFVSYTDQSWSDWAANGIPDAAFTQTMINLNTGYIFYADGTSQGTPPAGLVGSGTAGKTVESFLATKYGQLKITGSQRTYTEYVDAYSSSKGNSIASTIAEQFNCGCLQTNNGVLSADTIKTCGSDKSSSCLLTGALNQLSAGLVINSQGTVMTPDQDLATELAQGALGQVTPIQGYGDQFDKILQMFPGAQQDAIANAGVLTISIGTNLAAAKPVKILGAEPDNYSAKGMYIYQCQNTPFAKMLKNQAGGSFSKNATAANFMTDYIVFLDQNLNQVPLMAPVQDPKNYNFVKMSLNPAIKYVSSIIGNFDDSGNFSFLPQLHIQSSQALIAKGLPASFPPLYGLQAKNGTLAINYNQNLTSVIGTIVQSLASHPKLGQQFKTMQAAMLRLLSSGPFGKYKLSPVDESMQPVIGGVNLVMYTGFNSYPVPQGNNDEALTDLLIPLSAQGKTVVLPSNNVTEYYGLVTDLTYTVKPDGTIVVAADGFANSPLIQSGSSAAQNISWAIDPAKASQFYWINKLTTMGQQSDPQFAMPQALLNFINQARSAWIAWIQKSSNKFVNGQFAGITVPGTSTILTIVDQQAMNNNLFVYTCNPNPSNLTQDFFVLTNNAKVSVTDQKLGTMSAQNATAATNMLSLITGQLYNGLGNLINVPAVDPATLIQSLYKYNPQGFSDDFKSTLNVAVSQSAIIQQSLVYPFMFGGLQLGIYQADIDSNRYLYVDAAGVGTSADFSPSNYFVCVDSYTNPKSIGTELVSSTQFIVSLISGQVYDQNGVVDTMASSLLSKIIGDVSSSLSADQMQQIKFLTATYVTTQQYQQQQTAQMSADSFVNNGSITWSQAQVKSVITALGAQKFLPAPYNMIKQDPMSGMYVVVSPANKDQTQFMYTFVDVPNSFVDSSGKSVRVGAIYDDAGNLLRVIKGLELSVILQQYGISVDASGKQSLGAYNQLSMMPLDPADINLKPGLSGKSMIYSNDPSFPSSGIVSPIAYNNSNFYIYYNTMTQSYYALQVTGSKACYIDIVSGNMYGLNGQPLITTNPVAMNINGDSSDLFLPYANPDNFLRCMMKNNGNNFSDFLNVTDSFQGFVQDPATNNSCGLNQLVSLDASVTNVTIAQMPFPGNLTVMPDITIANQYNVYKGQSKTPVTYAVNSDYQWQNLQLLPINMQTRTILNPMPADMYKSAGLVMKSKMPFGCVFANQLYTNVQPAAQNSYSMTNGSHKIIVSVVVDNKTNVSYISIVSDGIMYSYQYTFAVLSAGQLEDYQQNVWKARTVVDVTGKVILVESLPVNALSAVNAKSVVNFPADSTVQANLLKDLTNILQDVENSRFVTQVTSAMYSYVNQNCFVDLENGGLFDSLGAVLGYTLQPADFMSLVKKLGFAVVRNKNSNQIGLMYLSGNAAAGNSVATVQQYQPNQQIQSNSVLKNQTVTNPAVVALQQENMRLQNDMNQKQTSLSKETIAARKTPLQNGIAADKAQIAANNKKIKTLSSQFRSRLLGRLNSQSSKKNRKK